jgi:ATP-dependent DNA helicase RecG
MPDSHASEYKRLSQRARQLLVREEGFDVDFKRSVSGLEADDIVAFANAKAGGAILIGVDECRNSDGRQCGTVVGCPVGDPEKRKILDKAHQCVPPINITVHVENRTDKPFYRIEIPSGPNKPYCTSGGTYKTRGDGRKNTLYPTVLLALFLETEGGEFLRRFQQVTSSLEKSIEDTKKKITSDLGDLASSVEQMEFNVEQSLDRVGGSAESAEENAVNANSYAEEALHMIEQVYSLVENNEDTQIGLISQKLDALLKHFCIEDPRITSKRQVVKAVIGALSMRFKELGVETSRASITKVAKKILNKPGQVSYPNLMRDAVNDLDGSAQAFSESSELDRLAIFLEVDRLLPRTRTQDTVVHRSATRKGQKTGRM